jgi:hypothetical protein
LERLDGQTFVSAILTRKSIDFSNHSKRSICYQITHSSHIAQIAPLAVCSWLSPFDNCRVIFDNSSRQELFLVLIFYFRVIRGQIFSTDDTKQTNKAYRFTFVSGYFIVFQDAFQP